MIYFFLIALVVMMIFNVFILARKRDNLSKFMIANMIVNQAVPMLLLISLLIKDFTLVDISFFYILLSFIPIIGLWFYYQHKK